MKKKIFAMTLAMLMALLAVPTRCFADTPVDGGTVNTNTTDESVDDTQVVVKGILIVKNKDTGEILYREEMSPAGDLPVVTVQNAADVVADEIEQIGNRLMQKALDYVDENNIPEIVVEDNSTVHDERTYTMKTDEDGNRYMHISGAYGYYKEYILTLEIETAKQEVTITPDPTGGAVLPSVTPSPETDTLPDQEDASDTVFRWIGIAFIILAIVAAIVMVVALATTKRKK